MEHTSQAVPLPEQNSSPTPSQPQLFGTPADPIASPVNYRERAREVRAEMHCREIGFPEWRLLDRVVLNSFDVGRRYAIIPKQKYICDAEGLDKGTVSAAVDRFVQNEVIECRGEIWEILPVIQWRLPPRLERERAAIAAGAVERLGSLNEVQPWLSLWPESLHEAHSFSGPTQVGLAPTAVGLAPNRQRGDLAAEVGARPTEVRTAPTRNSPHTNVGSTGTGSLKRATLHVQKELVDELLADVLEFLKGSENRDRDIEGKPFSAQKEIVNCRFVIAQLAKHGKAQEVRETMALIKMLENTGHPTTNNRVARLLSELRKRTLELSWDQIFPNSAPSNSQ